jgi:periplasmic copper chaperone A
MNRLDTLHFAPVVRPITRFVQALILPAAIIGAGLIFGGPVQGSTHRLSISGAWVRMVLPNQPAAGYFTLSNHGAEAESLVHASSPACKTLMLHKSVNKNGQEMMVMVMSVVVPPHGQVKFAPGGYHLMCMSPTKAVTPGHTIHVTLRFKDGHTLGAEFPVRDAKGAAPMPPMKGM